ncbi:MAG: FAD-binding oxidoreductase, partial [Legionella sp.]|nr:FAD-binding oxidoreductase [Legionella sp.]
MKPISSWGRLTHANHAIQDLTRRTPLHTQLQNKACGIAYGMGRSYGDVCLNPDGLLWKTTTLDRFISFNQKTGVLRCEAGVLLQTIQQLFMPQGWMLPVTPGTQYVTIGGAIANDVHGKNHHHAGSFGNHLHQIELIRTNGEIILCGPNQQPEWFSATIGGLGLTGMITSAEIQLQRVKTPWINTETVPFDSLSDFFQLADDSEENWEYTVSWIDCFSKQTTRGLFMRGNASETNPPHKIQKKSNQLHLPVNLPSFCLNPLSLKAFNSLYFNLKKNQPKQQLTHYESFFYPLDNIQHWNRMYGKKGFYQYQCVIPREMGYDAIDAMLQEISKAAEGSFLAVLKTFGKRASLGMLSFPCEGVTLALDFPNKNQKTQRLFERLDKIVAESNGRIYPAKDARMPKALFKTGYPRHSE